MAFMAVLESDLRALSAEARRRYPAVKEGAEHAILKMQCSGSHEKKSACSLVFILLLVRGLNLSCISSFNANFQLRSLSSASEIAHNEDILRIFLMACEVRTVKLSVIGLSCIQNLISHDAVAPSALKEILSTLKDHAEMADESVQLKTLQTILIIFQSHLYPENEENTSQALAICLRLLESNRSSDSVRNTAAATFRQAVALIFDHVVCAESLPTMKFASGGQMSRTGTVTGDVSRGINLSESLENEFVSGVPTMMRETLTNAGKLGLRLLEDLTALAAGGSVLQHQICSLLMTSIRTNAELEGEAGEPSFRRLVLRSVAHIIRLYSSSLITECEVFLSMLVKIIFLDLPLWHRILVLEILRGFCVEARTLRVLFQNFDMHPKNTNVVEGMVKALARVVAIVQVLETSEESLAAVAGMFSSKAKGIEWSLDNDASNAAVLVASEAHSITLAVEGLLGVVFTVATLTDEAVEIGELESPRGDNDPPAKCTGKTASLCISMVDSLWLTILDALSLILSRSQGEAIVLEVLKGYQAFTQACGVLRAVEPLNSFLASLCKFTIHFPNEVEKRSALHSPGSKRSESLVDQRDNIVLTPKNVQALRTLFNIAHRLHNVLGPSWVLVLETLAALDRAIHSPHATTQEVSTAVPKLMRESSSQYSDFNILSSLNSQLFESSALMHLSAVQSLLSALCQLSHQSVAAASSAFGLASSQKFGSISFSVERMISILVNNLHRVEPLWDQVVGHFLERHGDKLHYSWHSILEMLRSVADVSEKDLVTMGFQSLRVIMNDGLSTIPEDCLNVCIDVTGAYSAQKTELNISLTAVGLLWTATDFIAKGLIYGLGEEKETGISDAHSVPKPIEGEKAEEQAHGIANDMNDQASSVYTVDCDKLLFSVFSLLQKLGADDRPEVRNSAVRTLFQTLGSYGQKLSKTMWEDCLWNYVFPTLDRASHMAATSSKDEWQGKELGTRGGKSVHMLIHHRLGNLKKNSMLNGTLAAQTTVLSHSLKGNLPKPYLDSVLDTYEFVLQKSPNYTGNAASKVKQEILHGLGELYVQGQRMFDDCMYTQLLAIVDLAVKQAIITTDNFETEFGHVPPVLRTVLEILPLLRPTEQISSMWLILLREFLLYLPQSNPPLESKEDESEHASTNEYIPDGQMKTKDDLPNGTASISPTSGEVTSLSSGTTTALTEVIPSSLFAEKLVPVLVDLFLQAPEIEKYIIFPELVQSLGRCMTTRRDSPDGALWRLAVEGFNRILVDDVSGLTINGGPTSTISKSARTRIWKEIADVYEIFLVGYCGRALPSNSPSPAALRADELLEITILNTLGDKILKSQIDAPINILQQLVSTLDRCASRTCSLPIETVELMPSHCGKFSLTCLQKLFTLSSYRKETNNWNLTRSEVSKISIIILMNRCEYILTRFLTDENELGERPLPTARLEEIIFVLQELARLIIHPDTASVLPLHPFLKSGLVQEESRDNRPHLLVLFPSFCELVISREARVRELVQVLLRLITTELALEKAKLLAS
ncbi:hypothetical protein CJ030_MR8G022169 [Morella rubra]|uniref:Protein MON2 homolog n=1 Tax=Morella rubra TaxID=262757 RepID=A0A6A1UR57_9ROSI|nr:hypothetical protein CJ030_MR8G022169 [Morella rubra]